MSNAKGKMIVRLEDGGWMIDHEGPIGEEIQSLFDTKTLPSPFLEETPIEAVISTLQHINPDCEVVAHTKELTDDRKPCVMLCGKYIESKEDHPICEACKTKEERKALEVNNDPDRTF